MVHLSACGGHVSGCVHKGEFQTLSDVKGGEKHHGFCGTTCSRPRYSQVLSG